MEAILSILLMGLLFLAPVIYVIDLWDEYRST